MAEAVKSSGSGIGTLTETPCLQCEALAIGGSSEYVTAPHDGGAPQGSCTDCAAAVERYVTARRRRLQELRSKCNTEEEFEIEKSREHWTEVGSPCSEEDLLVVANRQHFQILKQKYVINRPHSKPSVEFFCDYADALEVGRKIAEGGQAEIFEATRPSRDGGRENCVLKVFKSGYSLADLQRQWTFISDSRRLFPGNYESKLLDLPILIEFDYLFGGTLLKDGSFAFVMPRYWGDLRRLIDLRIEEKSPPFQFPVVIMLEIAQRMIELHMKHILHKDLKASNVLVDFPSLQMGISSYEEQMKAIRMEDFVCHIIDYESSGGVLGTGFWRAPEVLRAIKSRDSNLKIWTEKVDVYSYAMTCYEVLTGCVPLEHLTTKDYDAVIVRGEGPHLPDYIDKRVQNLLRRCWHSDPEQRPTFELIVRSLQSLLRMERAWVGARQIELGLSLHFSAWADN